jgi:Tfp pilus assembly protein PilF
VLLVFYFALLLTGSSFSALIVALFFAIHPLQVETVSWVLERRNLLFALFFFCSLSMYLKYLQSWRAGYLVLSFAAMILGGLSKGLVFLMPLSMLLCDYYRRRCLTRRFFIEKIPFFALAIIGFIVTLQAANSGIKPQHAAVSQINWLMAQFSIAFYIYKTILPFNLSPVYEITEAVKPYLFLGPLALFGLLAAWFCYLRRFRFVTFGLLFFLLNILPVSGLIRVGFPLYACAHFMYIPIFGILFAGANYFELLYEKKQGQRLVPMALIVVMVLFSFISHSNTYHWQNSISLFERAVEFNPIGKFARNQLGIAYSDTGNLPEAQRHFKFLIATYPEFYSGYSNMGKLRFDQKKYQQSLEYYNRAIELNDDETDLFIKRGKVLLILKDYKAALKDLQLYKTLEPAYERIDFYIGVAHRGLGNYLAAQRSFTNCLKRYSNIFVFMELAGTQLNNCDFAGVFLTMHDGLQRHKTQLSLMMLIETQKMFMNKDLFYKSLWKNFPGRRFVYGFWRTLVNAW